MIVAHFFLRRIRKKSYLYVETTSSTGLDAVEPNAARLLEVDENDDRRSWIKPAYLEFSRLHPDLELLDPMENDDRLNSEHPSFDLVFRPKLE